MQRLIRIGENVTSFPHLLLVFNFMMKVRKDTNMVPL